MSGAVDNTLSSDSQILRHRPQKLIVAIALAVFTGGAVDLSTYGWRQSGLFLISGLLGVSLYHSRFGFSSAFFVK